MGVFSVRKTTEQFVEDARKVHGDKYDYSKVEYIDAQTKVCIICPVHGEFWQTPNGHLSGSRCHACAIESRSKKRSLNTEQFIARAKEKHGNRYNYSKAVYKGWGKDICIICPEHGEFWQRSDHHINGSGCPKCRGWNKTTEDFIRQAQSIHKNKYDYSKAEYKGWNKKVCIICPIHGEFYQRASDHMRGKGCFKCRIDNSKISQEDFVRRANELHNHIYDYSLTVYEYSYKKVKIICPTHGVFEQTPNAHLLGNGCPHCSNDTRRKTTEQFIKDAIAVHGDAYDYSMVEYHQSFEKVRIICPIHGIFEQAPHHHIEGSGCPKCSKSKGEKAIEEFLKEHKVSYRDQYKIILQQSFWKQGDYLRVDFYLPDQNTIVEFNGIQHYEEVECFHKGDNGFVKQKERDKRLRKWCKDNGVRLITIKYTQIDNIKRILKDKLLNKNGNEND